MNLSDARIVAADGAALAEGRFSFHAHADNQVDLNVPAGDWVAVAISDRVTHIRSIHQIVQRTDGFFDVEDDGVSLSTEFVTSRTLGSQNWLPVSLEATWTGSAAHLSFPHRPQSGESAPWMTLVLDRLTIRSEPCNAGIKINLAGEISGATFVAKDAPGTGPFDLATIPRGRIEVEFVLPWAWILMQGWPLAHFRPGGKPEPIATNPDLSGDPRNLRSLILRSYPPDALLVGRLLLDDKRHAQPLWVAVYETIVNFSPGPAPDLPPGFPRFVHLIGIGAALWTHIFRESDAGAIDFRGPNLGHLIHESDDEITVTQPITAIKAAIRRSARGVDLHIDAVMGPLDARIYGRRPPPGDELDVSGVVAAHTLTIDALVPMALLIARSLPGRTPHPTAPTGDP